MPDVTVIVSSLFTVFAILLSVFYFRYKRRTRESARPSSGDATVANQQSTQPGGPASPAHDKNSQAKPWPVGLENADLLRPDDKNDEILSDVLPLRDVQDYCSHLQREIKRTKHRMAMKTIEADMTEQQKEEERQAQRRQLEEIFKLMKAREDEFGLSSAEVQEQVKLYIQG